MTNKNYEIIKKQIAEANKVYTIRGEKCTKQEAIESFEKYSGYTLNELGVKHD